MVIFITSLRSILWLSKRNKMKHSLYRIEDQENRSKPSTSSSPEKQNSEKDDKWGHDTYIELSKHYNENKKKDRSEQHNNEHFSQEMKDQNKSRSRDQVKTTTKVQDRTEENNQPKNSNSLIQVQNSSPQTIQQSSNNNTNTNANPSPGSVQYSHKYGYYMTGNVTEPVTDTNVQNVPYPMYGAYYPNSRYPTGYYSPGTGQESMYPNYYPTTEQTAYNPYLMAGTYAIPYHSGDIQNIPAVHYTPTNPYSPLYGQISGQQAIDIVKYQQQITQAQAYSNGNIYQQQQTDSKKTASNTNDNQVSVQQLQTIHNNQQTIEKDDQSCVSTKTESESLFSPNPQPKSLESKQDDKNMNINEKKESKLLNKRLPPIPPPIKNLSNYDIKNIDSNKLSSLLSQLEIQMKEQKQFYNQVKDIYLSNKDTEFVPQYKPESDNRFELKLSEKVKHKNKNKKKHNMHTVLPPPSPPQESTPSNINPNLGKKKKPKQNHARKQMQNILNQIYISNQQDKEKNNSNLISVEIDKSIPIRGRGLVRGGNRGNARPLPARTDNLK